MSGWCPTVYLFDTFSARPVYHDYGRIRDAGTDDSCDVTKCGLVMYSRASRVLYRAMLREDHARLFARPCSRCFAVADSEPASAGDNPEAEEA